jgi:hypothetical protein
MGRNDPRPTGPDAKPTLRGIVEGGTGGRPGCYRDARARPARHHHGRRGRSHHVRDGQSPPIVSGSGFSGRRSGPALAPTAGSESLTRIVGCWHRPTVPAPLRVQVSDWAAADSASSSASMAAWASAIFWAASRSLSSPSTSWARRGTSGSSARAESDGRNCSPVCAATVAAGPVAAGPGPAAVGAAVAAAFFANGDGFLALRWCGGGSGS